MIDIQHDSPVPIHEQIASQLMAHIASGSLKAGAKLAEYRAFARQLLTNPQVVAKAYADLEWDGVLKRASSPATPLPEGARGETGGEMEVATGADVICRVRLQDQARRRLRQAVADGRLWGLPEEEIRRTVDQALTARPASSADIQHAFTVASHASSHRDPQAVQVLSGQESRGPAEPQHPSGSDIRPARR
jgi:GntR family transcriptional regulator